MSAISLRLGIYRISPAANQRVRQFGVDGPLGILGERVYNWATSEDIYADIADAAEREKIRQQIASFHAGESDTHASIRRLCVLSEELAKVSAKGTWVPANFIKTEGEFGSDTRSSPTLAFAHHLRWVCETFRDTPNLMVIFE